MPPPTSWFGYTGLRSSWRVPVLVLQTVTEHKTVVLTVKVLSITRYKKVVGM